MKSVDFVRYFRQYAAATPALLTVLSLGTHLGWTSPALHQLLSGESSIKLSNSEGSWFVSIISIGNLMGLLIMIGLSNVIGRKPTILIVTFPLLLSWILIIIAENVWVLYIARLLAGIGMAMSATAVPVYTGEIATDDLRSALSSSFQIMLASGPIIEYAMVPQTSVKLSAALSAILPLIIIIMVFWMPESPYYLLIENKEEEARKNLRILRGDKANIEKEFEAMKKTVEYQMTNKSTFKELFSRVNTRNGLFIMFGMYTIQAFCGTVVILFYAHVIFEKVELTSVSPNILALIMISIPCVSSIISTAVVEYTGKKPLLILSTFLCFITMFLVGAFFQLQAAEYDVSNLKWVPVISLISFKFVHGLGIAGIPFIQLGELFSANIKIHAVCTCKCYLFICHFTGNKMYQIISDNLGFCAPFYIFSAFSLLGVFFVIFFVPETTGKSLHEIQLQLGAKYDDEKEEEPKEKQFNGIKLSTYKSINNT